MAHSQGRTGLLGRLGRSLARGFGTGVRGVGFWAAILLPAIYVPLLLLNHPWLVDVGNVVKILAIHGASLFLGRDYRTSLGGERREGSSRLDGSG